MQMTCDICATRGRGWFSRIDTEIFKVFGTYDLDFDLLPLVCKLDLDMIVTYLVVTNLVFILQMRLVGQWAQKDIVCMETQTDKCKGSFPLSDCDCDCNIAKIGSMVLNGIIPTEVCDCICDCDVTN